MRYYKIVDKGYIFAVGSGDGGTKITKSEYNDIMKAIESKPVDKRDLFHRLKEDMTWESFVPEFIEKITEDPEEKLERVTKAIEKLRDDSVLPTTKAIYQSILDLFEGGE